MKYKIVLVLVAFSLLGCDDLDAFRSGEDDVFRGTVAGGKTGEEGSFIRSGFVAGTKLELTFDPDFNLQSEEASSAGTISTFAPMDGNPDKWSPGDFQNTPLDVIAPLAHDPLTQYTFPGGERIRNYVFSALFMEGSRSALVFVSLMEDKDIEARIIAPGVQSACASELKSTAELFGVFRLKRESR
ncbi:MAG: hypothetical protein JXA30_14895 [Deltaproteobacteria bacterium]|nr:hypothetical protein [Deltaproteobacteria bacterium]